MFVFVVDVGGGGVYCCFDGVGWVDFIYCVGGVVYCLLFEWYGLLGIDLVGFVWCVVVGVG